MHLSRERNGEERERGEGTPGVGGPSALRPAGALDRQQREREEDGDPADQVDAALREPVGGDREREPADEGARGHDAERTEPPVREQPGGHDRPQQEHVPGDHGPEERLERPEGQSEGPGPEYRLRLDERLEAVRVDPGRLSPLELVPGEPEAVDGLEVVPGGGLAAAVGPVGDERAPEGADRRPRRRHGKEGVEP
ncbi:MAG: hypothetical protein ACRDOG_08250 [Gaiellaceae bacterium]